jgi:outer membrane protein OmpA-like peptidoglycan-associated protein
MGKGMRKFRSLVFVGLGAAILGACSSVPDAANPVEWYKSAENLVRSSDLPAAQKVKRVDAEGKEVKGAPVVSGLAADHSRAKYADEPVKRDTGAGGVPPIASQSAPQPASATKEAAKAKVAPAQPTAVAAAPVPVPPPAPTYARPVLPQTLTGAPPGDPIEEVFRKRLAESAAATGQVTPITPRSAAPAPMMAQPMAMAQPQYAPPPAPMSASGRPQPFTPILSPAEQPGYVAPLNLQSPGGAPSRVASVPQLGSSGSMGAAPGFLSSTVYFGSGSTKISASDRQKLSRSIDAARDRDGFLRVVGHASSSGGHGDQVGLMMANFQIAMDRANSVARELVKMGVPADRIRIDANTDAAPGMSGGDSAERRAEIFVES